MIPQFSPIFWLFSIFLLLIIMILVVVVDMWSEELTMNKEEVGVIMDIVLW